MQTDYSKYLTLPDENLSRLEKFILPEVGDQELQLFVVRDDLIHPAISGNKWRKIKYNLQKAKEDNYKTILTFGGAFSNHIFAIAALGKIYGFKTIGIIRGEEYSPLNPTLDFATEMGMQLHYLPREIYRNRNIIEFQNSVAEQFDNPYIVPEGGSNLLALKGVGEIYNLIPFNPSYVFTAVGSGGTIAGLINGANKNTKIHGIPALKNGSYLKEIIFNFTSHNLANGEKLWSLFTDYHFGGFAKINSELIEFVENFESLNSFKLDYVYTAKMFYAIYALAKQKYFCKDDKIVAVHTGGLQGNKGMIPKIEKMKESFND